MTTTRGRVPVDGCQKSVEKNKIEEIRYPFELCVSIITIFKLKISAKK